MNDNAPGSSPELSRDLVAFTPVPRAKNRSDGWKAEVQKRFIEALADTGSVAAACRMVGRSERSAYMLRRHPEGAEFAAAWAAAQGHGVLRLQDAVLDRALNGVEVPVVAYGAVVATYRQYDNRLAAFILRNHLPWQYGEEGGRAAHAIDAKKLARLKNEWRQEWQAERDREQDEARAGAADFVDRIKTMHVHWWSALSPRARAAYVHFRRVERLDGRRWLDREEDADAAIAAAEAEYPAVFAGDGRSRALLLGEMEGIGDEATCPELGDGDPEG